MPHHAPLPECHLPERRGRKRTDACNGRRRGSNALPDHTAHGQALPRVFPRHPLLDLLHRRPPRVLGGPLSHQVGNNQLGLRALEHLLLDNVLHERRVLGLPQLLPGQHLVRALPLAPLLATALRRKHRHEHTQRTRRFSFLQERPDIPHPDPHGPDQPRRSQLVIIIQLDSQHLRIHVVHQHVELLILPDRVDLENENERARSE